MAEDNVMQNIDISSFESVSKLDDTDYVVLSLTNGLSAKARVDLLKAVFAAVISPSVKDGVWYVGEKNIGVNAEGRTPELRRGSIGIEWKYTDDDTWQTLVPYNDIKLQFDTLTTEQKDEIIDGVSISVHEEVIKPVNDAISAAQSATRDAETAKTLAEKAADNADNAAKNAQDVVGQLTEDVNNLMMVYDGGRADTVYGGAREVNCGGADA